MGYSGEPRFRIDLGAIHAQTPCEQHKDQGYDSDCDACEQTPEREIKVPHLEGFFVELLNPDLLAWGKKKKLYAPVAALPDVPTQADRQVQADAVQARRERIVAGLVTAWNLVDAEDESESPAVLPLPKNDPSALDRAPDIVNQVWAGLAREQQRQARRNLPKAPVTSSGA